MPPRFSVVLIARNEAKTLPRLMKSLGAFQASGGEVVLVDTGSTDSTAALARQLGCKVWEEGERFLFEIDERLAKRINDRFVVGNEAPVVNAGDRLFDYSSARNFAARCASNEIVAMPDCDEEFTALDLAKIEAAIAAGMQQAEYNFVYSHDEFGREAIKFAHSKFYDRRVMHWTGIVHEVLAGSPKKFFFPESEIKLEHWQNPSDHRSRYLTGLALDCFLHPENDRNSHYLARELWYKGRPRSAIQEFDRHIAMNRWPAEKAQSWIFKGDCFMQLGELEKGIAAYHQAIGIDGSRRETWLRLACHYWHRNDHQRAACYANAALVIPWNGYYANDRSHYEHTPHEILYWALWYLGDKAEAKRHWETALRYQPNNDKFKREAEFFSAA